MQNYIMGCILYGVGVFGMFFGDFDNTRFFYGAMLYIIGTKMIICP